MKIAIVDQNDVATLVFEMPDSASVTDDAATYPAAMMISGPDGEYSEDYEARIAAPAGHRLIVVADGIPAAAGFIATGAGEFAPPPAPPLTPAALAAFKASAMSMVIAYANEITARVTSRYPVAEVSTWPDRAAEARLIVNGAAESEAPTLMLVAAATGDTVANLAEAVLAKAAAYRQIVAAVEGVRTQAQAAIAACATPAEVDQTLAVLRQQAEAMAAEMGLAA